MNAIQEFCAKRGLNNAIEQAFTTYVKATYSNSLAVREGDTLSKIVNNLTTEKVEDMWLKFVYDLKETLPTTEELA